MLQILLGAVVGGAVYWLGYVMGRKHTIALMKSNKTFQAGNVVKGDMCGGDLHKHDDTTASSLSGCCDSGLHKKG